MSDLSNLVFKDLPPGRLFRIMAHVDGLGRWVAYAQDDAGKIYWSEQSGLQEPKPCEHVELAASGKGWTVYVRPAPHRQTELQQSMQRGLP